MLEYVKKYRLVFICSFSVFLFWWLFFSLPNPLFKVPYSTVLFDRNEQLLGGRIAEDGQWRFPLRDSLSDKFTTSIITFEDRRFWYHPGVDPIGLGRAIWQNLRHRSIVSGGSTLSMQVIRLSRRKPRNLWNKFAEVLLALRLELKYSKQEILAIYAAHAPFGGNVVGMETASWRYFGKKPALLSWSEAALLAVLPNQPSLIHPGRNRDALLAKRNRLLKRLFDAGAFDAMELDLSLQEPLPEQVKPLPDVAPHLLDGIMLNRTDEQARFASTLDPFIQFQVNQILNRYQSVLRQNEIHNLAALVVDNRTKSILAYVGNVSGAGAEHGAQVDIIKASRSTGSLLKPLLYAASMDDGIIYPTTLEKDVPTTLSGYRPENFHQNFDGVVPLNRALIRSLNVPFINLLQQYSLPRFHYKLNQLGLKGLDFPPDHYGLPLILGGVETSLAELVELYAGMAATLNQFHKRNGQYRPSDFLDSISWQPDRDSTDVPLVFHPTHLSAGAIWLTFNAMQSLERPGSEGEWERFNSSRSIAWKTGTSIGFRDAWAIGVTPEYTVGVWAGNADGEGRPGLIGVRAAAPVLFSIYDMLPATSWFLAPMDELKATRVCRKSGFPPGPYCESDTIWALRVEPKMTSCPYHQQVFLARDEPLRVHANCVSMDEMRPASWFVLPPLEGFYYRHNHADYQPLPPFKAGCEPDQVEEDMQMIYPKGLAEIFVPKDLDGEASRTIFSVAHNKPEATIYWHIDEKYIGETKTFHQMALNPAPGNHMLVLVDNLGNRLEQPFTIIAKEK